VTNAFGTARTRWGSFSAPPDPLAAIGGGVLLLRKREGEGQEKEGKETGKGRERDTEGERERDGKGTGIASSLFNFCMLRA